MNPVGGSCPECPCECEEPDGYCDACEARELAKRWAIRRSLTPGEALSIGRTALLNRHGIDCLTACDVHPRERLVSLEDRGLLSGTKCQPCDGDGWSADEDEVEGWELTQLGTPLGDAEDARLFAWVRERMAAEGGGAPDEMEAWLADAWALIDAAKAWPS